MSSSFDPLPLSPLRRQMTQRSMASTTASGIQLPLDKGANDKRPPPKDLSHHLSRSTKNRAASSMKQFYKYFQIPGIAQLAGGMRASDHMFSPQITDSVQVSPTITISPTTRSRPKSHSRTDGSQRQTSPSIRPPTIPRPPNSRRHPSQSVKRRSHLRRASLCPSTPMCQIPCA